MINTSRFCFPPQTGVAPEELVQQLQYRSYAGITARRISAIMPDLSQTCLWSLFCIQSKAILYLCYHYCFLLKYNPVLVLATFLIVKAYSMSTWVLAVHYSCKIKRKVQVPVVTENLTLSSSSRAESRTIICCHSKHVERNR